MSITALPARTPPDGYSEAYHAAMAAVEAFADGLLIGFDDEGRECPDGPHDRHGAIQ